MEVKKKTVKGELQDCEPVLTLAHLHHSTLGSRVMKKKRKTLAPKPHALNPALRTS